MNGPEIVGGVLVALMVLAMLAGSYGDGRWWRAAWTSVAIVVVGIAVLWLRRALPSGSLNVLSLLLLATVLRLLARAQRRRVDRRES